MSKKTKAKAKKINTEKAPEATEAPEAPAESVVPPPKEVVEPKKPKAKAEPKASGGGVPDGVPDSAPNTTKEGGAATEKKVKSYKIVLADGSFISRLCGCGPKQAANKGLTQIYKRMEAGSLKASDIHNPTGAKAQDGSIIFCIQESTRGSSQRQYVYEGKRTKLEQPSQYYIVKANTATSVVGTNRGGDALTLSDASKYEVGKFVYHKKSGERAEIKAINNNTVKLTSAMGCAANTEVVCQQRISNLFKNQTRSFKKRA